MRGLQVHGLDAAMGLDPQSISQSAQAIRPQATAAREMGESLRGRWDGLAAVYQAPEASDLQRAMVPVAVATVALSSAFAAVSHALETYAQDLAVLHVRQRSLAAHVRDLVREASAAVDWKAAPQLAARHASLQTAAAHYASGVDEAATRCAAAIEAARDGLTSDSGSPSSCDSSEGQRSSAEALRCMVKKLPFRSTETSAIRQLLTSAAWRKNVGVRGANRNDDFLSVLGGLDSGTYSIDEVLDALSLMRDSDRTALDYYLSTIAPAEHRMDFASQVLFGARSRAEVEDLVSAIPALEPRADKDVRSWTVFEETDIRIRGVQDINQGRGQDCWLLAGLGAALVSNKQQIKDNIVSNSNGTYTVTLYPDGKKATVTVSGRIPLDDSGAVFYARGDDGEPNWASIYEKAAAALVGDGSYGGLTAGHPATGIEITTGMDTETYGPLSNPFGSGYLSLDDIADLVSDDKPVTALVMLNGSDQSIAAFHVYYVTEVTEDGLIRVRNPWGHGGPTVQEEMLLSERSFNTKFSIASAGK